MSERSLEEKKEEMEIDLLDILHRIIAIRKILYKVAIIGFVIGIIVALSIPKKYTVNVTLSPEIGNSKGGNSLAGLAASFLGSNVTSESVDALNVSLSSDIISSTPFLLELFDINIPVSYSDTVTLKSYLCEQSVPWWNNITSFPGMVVGGIKSLFIDEDDKDLTSSYLQGGTIELTKKDSNIINYLKKNINATIDKKTAITNIAVTLQNPKVAAIVADSVIHKLQEYIINYRTSKSKEDCIYLEKLFKERQQEYYTTQKKYADYVDTHDNLILQTVRAEQERLQNDMGIAYQIYSQVANQLQVARAKVQEEKPVFAVVEPAVVPLNPSGIGMKIYVILSVFVAVSLTVVWELLGKRILNSLKNKIK
ncbi:Wzz/FepE/Etk N-terminal domain-containing protein [Bacteroides bouchesdurhonensis]